MTKLQKVQTSDSFLSEKGPIRVIITIAIIFLVAAFILSIGILFQETGVLKFNTSLDLSKTGAWGDTIGGILNPLFSFLALTGLLWTIWLQGRELELTRDELKGSRQASEGLLKAANQQNIENAFFQLFNLLQENLHTITIDQGAIPGYGPSLNTGTKAFEVFAKNIQNNLSNQVSEFSIHSPFRGHPDNKYENGWPEILKEHSNSLEAKKAIFIDSYYWVYRSNQADLGRYFRLLYNVLRFLKEKKGAIENESYETFHKLVRASISNYELFIIMANCLTPAGEPMKRFVSYFQLFDNLPRDILLVRMNDENHNHTNDIDFAELWLEFDEASFGENEDYRKLKLSSSDNTSPPI